MAATHHELGNLKVILDRNRIQNDDFCLEPKTGECNPEDKEIECLGINGNLQAAKEWNDLNIFKLERIT